MAFRNPIRNITHSPFAWLALAVLAVSMAACGPPATPTPLPTPTPSATPTPVPSPTAAIPLAPELEARSVEDAQTVELIWQEPPGAAPANQFVVERSTEGEDGPWQQITILPATRTGAADRGLQGGQTYWYRVIARNNVGDSPPSDVVSVELPEPTAIPPTDL